MISLQEVLKYVQQRRFCIQPSPVFEVQLKELEPICRVGIANPFPVTQDPNQFKYENPGKKNTIKQLFVIKTIFVREWLNLLPISYDFGTGSAKI